MSLRNPKKESWIETREYPNSRAQLLFSVVILLLAVVFFAFVSTGDISTPVTFFAIFASLTFCVVIFPQYLEFTGLSGELASKGAAKSKPLTGIGRLMPLVSSAAVLLVLPVVMVFVAPPSLFWGSITGIIFGFALYRLAFSLYVMGWARRRGFRVTRYSIVTRGDNGRRIVLERGLKASKS